MNLALLRKLILTLALTCLCYAAEGFVNQAYACQIVYDVECDLSPVRSIDGNALNNSGNPDAGGLKVVARVFSSTVCQIQSIITDVFGTMWCVISDGMRGPLAAAFTLYVTVMGILFTIGAVPLTLKEVGMRVLKMVLIWGFVTNADLALGLMFNFYMAILNDGIAIVLTNPANPSATGGVDNIMQRLDIVAGQIFATNQNNTEGRVLTALAGAAMIGVNFPGGATVGYGLFALSVMTFFVFARTVLTYLIAIIGIVYYLTLGPIMISLALFDTSKGMFEKWLQQLGSFALQPVIIFAYLMMAEAYIENVIDTFPTLDELMTQVAVKKEHTSIGTQTFIQDTMVFLQGNCDDPSNINNPDPDATGCPYVDPNYNWQNGGIGEISGSIAGMVALVLLNFATVKFLDFVPEIARQIASASRAIRLGGGAQDRSFAPSGAAIRSPTDGAMETFFQGIRSTTPRSTDPGEQIGERLSGGFTYLRHTFKQDFVRRMFPH